MKKLLSKINEVTPDDMVVTLSSLVVWSIGLVVMGLGVKMIMFGGIEMGHSVLGFWSVLGGFSLLFAGGAMTERGRDDDDL